MARYFGTDGVRGVAGVDLTPELVLRLARAAALTFSPGPVLLARDTRASGPALEAACAAGLAQAGSQAHLAGILPSPAVSHLLRREGFSLGVVISASHNPPEDNGVKFYNPQGLKLSEEEEARVEAVLDDVFPPKAWGEIRPWPEASDRYLSFLLSFLPPHSLRGVRIVVDCGFGATAVVAKDLFSAAGLEVTWLSAEPDGTRINATGAAHPSWLQAMVRESGAELGVGFDGDGDRALFVDRKGAVVEGDRLLAALAPLLRSWGELPVPKVVFTILGGLGPEYYLREQGFQVVRVPVGDRYVSWKMWESGALLGGEPSGHLIFGRISPTGDGLLTTLLLLRALARADKSLDELVRPVPIFPQVREDIPVRNREKAMADPGVEKAIAQARALVGDGRVIVRPSGTQSLVRIFAEGQDVERLRAAVAMVAAALRPHQVDQ